MCSHDCGILVSLMYSEFPATIHFVRTMPSAIAVTCVGDNGYLIERLLCKEPSIAYNDIAQWRYTALPEAFGCDDWLVRRVTTNEQLDAALKDAAVSKGAYIEVVTDTYAASPLASKLGKTVQLTS